MQDMTIRPRISKWIGGGHALLTAVLAIMYATIPVLAQISVSSYAFIILTAAIGLAIILLGTTTIGFTITPDGHVENVHVVNSSGSERLDNAAVNCAGSWHYKGAIKDNQPVAVPWKAEVKWVLH